MLNSISIIVLISYIGGFFVKKAWWIVLVCFITVLSFTACSLNKEDEDIDYNEENKLIDTYDIPTDEDKKYDIVLLTDSSGISSQSNLELWKCHTGSLL